MTDDDLRTRLRRTDPAASLAPLPPDRVSRLLEETMTAGVATLPARRRLLLPVLAAAAAVLLLAGAGWLIFRPSDPVVTLPQALPSAAPVRLTAATHPLDVVLSRLPYPVGLFRLPWAPPVHVRFQP